MRIKISKNVWFVLPLLLLSSCNGADISFMGLVEERIDIVKEKQQFGKKTTEEGKYDGKFSAGGNISGQMITEKNSALLNAMVSFKKDAEQKWITMQTDNKGNFKIINLKPGVYDFAFLAPGYIQKLMTGIEINTDKNSENENLKIILEQ